MARHRDIRNLDYDQEYDEAYDDVVYGHSVDDHEYGVSPSAEQYLYSQKGDANYGFGAYFPGTEKIREEEEDFDEPPDTRRRDSTSFERPRLSSEDEVKLNSVLDELRNVVGDQFSEAELVTSALEHHYDFESTLNSILTRKAPSSSSSSSRLQESNYKSKMECFKKSTRPDDEMLLCPFSYMIPLSYSFSSAFCFETGKIERIPLKEIIKDWYAMVTKNSRKSIKSIEKNHSQVILNKAEKLFLDSFDSVDSCSNAISLKTGKADINSGFERCTSNRVEKIDIYDSVDSDLSRLCKLNVKGEKSSVNDCTKTLPDTCSENVNEDITVKLQSIHIGSNLKVRSTPNAQPDVVNPIFGKGMSIPPLRQDVDNSMFGKDVSIPSLRQAVTKCEENKFYFSIPSLKNKENPLSFGSPTYSSSPKETSFIKEIGLPSLSSLDLAHLHEVGRSMHMAINRISCSPLSGSISESPLNRSSILSALASAHFGQKPSQLGDIPSFSSLGFRENASFKSCVKNELDNAMFQIPELQIKCNTAFEVVTDLSSFSSVTKLSTSSSQNEEFSEGLESDDVDVDSEEFTSDEYELFSGIDLNIALLSKNQDIKIDTEVANKKEDLNYAHIIEVLLESSMLPLSKEEHKCLAIRPSSFGETILRDKKKARWKLPSRRNTFIPFPPFDFSSCSPDDVVSKVLTKKKIFS